MSQSRYSSDPQRPSDDLNKTSSTLREKAISITRVRCKKRSTWIRAPITGQDTETIDDYFEQTLISPGQGKNERRASRVRSTLIQS